MQIIIENAGGATAMILVRVKKGFCNSPKLCTRNKEPLLFKNLLCEIWMDWPKPWSKEVIDT